MRTTISLILDMLRTDQQTQATLSGINSKLSEMDAKLDKILAAVETNPAAKLVLTLGKPVKQ